jgi:hypothetical protein
LSCVWSRCLCVWSRCLKGPCRELNLVTWGSWAVPACRTSMGRGDTTWRTWPIILRRAGCLGPPARAPPCPRGVSARRVHTHEMTVTSGHSPGAHREDTMRFRVCSARQRRSSQASRARCLLCDALESRPRLPNGTFRRLYSLRRIGFFTLSLFHDSSRS